MHYIHFASTVKLFIARATGEQKPEQSERTQGGICYLQHKYTDPSSIFHVFSTQNFQGCSLIWKAARLGCPLLLKTKRYCEFAHFILKPKGQRVWKLSISVWGRVGGDGCWEPHRPPRPGFSPYFWVTSISSSSCSSSCS